MTVLTPLESQWWNPLSWEGAPVLAVVTALWFIVMARANATYWVGRAIEGGIERSRWKGLVESGPYRRAQGWLRRWGAPAVALSFLTIGVQTMVNLAAGAGKMPLRRYLPAVAFGSVLWAMLYGTVGFVGVHALIRLWAVSPWWVVGVGTASLLALAGYIRFARRRRIPFDSPSNDDTPVEVH